MKLAVDTNVLIYAHLPVFAEHECVRSYLLERLATPDITLVITAMILHEFVHVVTDGRRFQPPLTMSEALAVSRLYLGRSNVECLPVGEDMLLKAFQLVERHRLGRKRLADTMFVAALLHHGVKHLITCNPSDFEVFTGISLVDPCKAD